MGIRTLVAWNPRAVWTVILCWNRRRVCRQGSWRGAWHWLRDCSCRIRHPTAPRGRLFADTPESRAPVTYLPELTQTTMWRKLTSTWRDLGFLRLCFWGFRSSGIWRYVAGWVVPDVSEYCFDPWRLRHSVSSKHLESLAQRRSAISQKTWVYILRSQNRLHFVEYAL